VSSLCPYYGISRNGYFKSIKAVVKAEMSKSVIQELVWNNSDNRPFGLEEAVLHVKRESSLKQVYSPKQEKKAKSKAKSEKRYVRYSICFKEQVMREESECPNISKVCRRYGIKGGDRVQGRIKRLGRNELLNETVYVKTKGEMDELKRFVSENVRLKISLFDLLLSHREQENLISSVNARYQTDVKTEFGTLE
jgi:hypothetical protein